GVFAVFAILDGESPIAATLGLWVCRAGVGLEGAGVRAPYHPPIWGCSCERKSTRNNRSCFQRSTSRFQRLVHSSRWALMASQSDWITSLARAPTGAMRSSGMLTSTLVLTGPLPISLAKLVCTAAEISILMKSWASGLAEALATGQAEASRIGAPSLG